MAAKAEPRTIVVRTPSVSKKQLARAAGGAARRGLVGAARAAMTEKHTLTALATAAGLGYIERERLRSPTRAAMIPHINALGVDGTVGAALWLAGRYTKNPILQHAATGALSCAIKTAVVGDAATPGTPGYVAPGAAPGGGGGGAPVMGYHPAPARGPGVMGGAF